MEASAGPFRLGPPFLYWVAASALHPTRDCYRSNPVRPRAPRPPNSTARWPDHDSSSGGDPPPCTCATRWQIPRLPLGLGPHAMVRIESIVSGRRVGASPASQIAAWQSPESCRRQRMQVHLAWGGAERYARSRRSRLARGDYPADGKGCGISLLTLRPTHAILSSRLVYTTRPICSKRHK